MAKYPGTDPLPPGAPDPDKGILGSSPRTSKAGLTGLITMWSLGIIRLVLPLSRGEEPTWPAIEAGVIGVIGLVLYFLGRSAQDGGAER